MMSPSHVSQLESEGGNENITTQPPSAGEEAVELNTSAKLENQKTTHGETMPGWTIMRPLRMKGVGKGKARTEKKSDGVLSGSVVLRGRRINESVGNKSDEGLKKMETNGDGDPGGVGEVEVLTDLRSDDGLLEDGDQDEIQSQRNVGAEGEPYPNGNNALNGTDAEAGSSVTEYKVYKRRWFGLVQLVLLNIIVSWDWLTFSASSQTASQYYGVSESTINWLSTGFLFAFVVASPFTIYTLHRGGPRPSIITAAVLLLLGNWIRYGATRAGPQGNFAGVLIGQILTGLAQPFVLSAPTRYSDIWFTNRGRVAATAIMSLANPFGGAFAQLVDPFWANAPSDIPNLVLYVTIISSIATIPSFFIPALPPTPCSPSAHEPKQPLSPSLKFLFTSPEFYLIMIPFTIYVGLFNSASSLINQILEPYSFSETEAGIAGALLILVGLACSAVTSPIIDKTKTYLLAIKVCVPVIALAYLAFTWAPQTRSLGAIYAILSILGAASFSLVPVVLEYLIEITHPVSPEVTSTICWTGGQFLGGIFIVISDALRASGVNDGSQDDGTTRPKGNMWRALVFQTVVAMAIVPFPLVLGCFGRGHEVRMRRIEADERVAGENSSGNGNGEAELQ